ncbi:hypothetical protein Tco_0446270, partial [Tanacetum coccineum]
MLLDQMSYLSKKAYSTVKRLIHKNTSFKNSNIDQRINTVRGKKINIVRPKAVVNAVKGNNFNVVKASACWVWKSKNKVLDHVSKHNSGSITLKKFDYINTQGNPQMDLHDQGVIDSGCTRHMTGNMSYLTNYEEIDGGYVAFGGNPKGGKIIEKEVYLPNFLKMIKPVLLVKRETSTSTTLVSCDGHGGYDWSDQAEEGPNYALIAYSSSSSDSEVSNDSTCSKSCLETVKLLKSQYDQLLKDFKKSELMVLGEITIGELRKKLEIVQKEKDGIQFNVDKFENASKSLNKIIECQIVDNYKKGLGYNTVPPPYTGNFMPPTRDLSFTGLDEFFNEPVVENSKAKSSEEEPKKVRKN